MKIIRKLPFEAIFWSASILCLACIDQTGDHHVSLCPIANLGFDFCPGCGLGRSISFLLHGEVMKSLRMHPLGVLALSVLLVRIFELVKIQHKLYGKSNKLPS